MPLRQSHGLPIRWRGGPRSSAILDETFARIRASAPGTLPAVKSIFLSNYFNVIQLDDLTVRRRDELLPLQVRRRRFEDAAELEAMLPCDPLLMSYLFASGEPDLLQLSLKACLVSPLSETTPLTPPVSTCNRPSSVAFCRMFVRPSSSALAVT